MIQLFEDYLHEKKSLSLGEMQKLHRNIAEEIGTDQDALELYDELLKTAVRYAGIRAKWPLLSQKEKMDQDSSRTSAHDSVITKFNMLSRCLKMHGKKAEWRDILGDADADSYNRKRIGDFACFLAFINGLNAR